MTLDRHQVAYRENRPTEDAVSPALHMALTHLEHPNTYVRMPFVDFGSAFNAAILDKRRLKLHLGLAEPLCFWIQEFFSHRPQLVRIGDRTSSTLTTMNTGTPQGRALGPALLTLLTHDSSAT